MSVKRYTNGADDDQGQILPFMEESPEGDYVEYVDYARLKAENERLRKWMDDISLDTEGRLDSGLNVGWTLLKIKQEYNAAKEGKPSV